MVHTVDRSFSIAYNIG